MSGHLIRVGGRYVTYFAFGERLLPGESEAVGRGTPERGAAR
jgi:hypothetical protein